MTTPKETAQHILRYLFSNANGDAADAIKKYQGNELPGFGIMYPQLKELAAKYEPNNDVAIELITKNTREARMIAMILCMPETLTDSQIKQFIEGAITEELKNLMARHIIAPLLRTKNYQQLIPVFPKEILLKGLVQSFRIEKKIPDFTDCIEILENIVSNQHENSTDIFNFIEGIYRYHIDKRNNLKTEIEGFAIKYPEKAEEIGYWLSNIKDLEEIYGGHKF
jgi:hypothetical protein